jgi:hypothetical protein
MTAVVLASRGVAEPTGAIAAIGRWEWLELPLYAVLTIVAIDPELVRSGTDLEPLQVEGAVMTLLVLVGIMFAWLLFTDPQTRPEHVPD